jgi:aminoglycoside phosphotransferase (APT) family kinase protein
MEFVAGRVLWDQALPALDARGRAAIYDEMNRVIAALHCGRSAGGRPRPTTASPGNYFERQIARWSKQYQASITEPIEAMDASDRVAAAHIPASARDDTQVSIVHGDYRLDNLVFRADEPRIVAVLDWELSTLGHPLADFSYHCMSWHIAPGGAHGVARHRRPRSRCARHPDRARVRPALLRAHRQDRQAGRRRRDGRLELLPRLQPVPDRRHPAGHRQARRGRHGVERAGAPVAAGARPLAEMGWRFAQQS